MFKSMKLWQTLTLMGMVFCLPLVVLLVLVTRGGADEVPSGLQKEAMNIPQDNPLTPEKVALGKQLFWDKRWSKGQTVACATCHMPENGWSDSGRFSNRYDGKPTSRHSPTIINRVFSELQQWTGARKSLEDQAYKASDSSPETIVQNLASIKGYDEQFRKVFGSGVTAEGVAKAISAYERMILSGDSPYDRFQAGDNTAWSQAAQRGLALFQGKARCARCHGGFNFTDEGYHNIGVGMDKENPDLGRHTVSKIEVNKGAFKTPTLRDVALRTPYMHDGSLRTLQEVIDFYNRGGIPNPWLSKDIVALNLSLEEQADLVAFLKSLTGKVSPDIASPPLLPDDSRIAPAANAPDVNPPETAKLTR